MHEGDVLLFIRGYQKRLEHWDDLLVRLATNIVAPPRISKKQLDVKKMRLFKRADDPEESQLKKDTEYASAWLAALKRRQGGE